VSLPLGSGAERCAGSSPVTRTSRVFPAEQIVSHFVVGDFCLGSTGYFSSIL